MSLFKKVTKEHVIEAIKRIDNNGLEGFTDSKYYDLLYENKRFPPKPIMALAEEIASGKKVSTTDFQGGIGTKAFNKLKSFGFEIVEKSNRSFAPQLKLFLNQAKTDNLKTKDYLSSYNELKVKVSFGQGAVARIPWISFLGRNQSTSNGIYPVYLFFKKEGLIILAYGISETNQPDITWGSNGKETIAQYFEHSGKKPERYGGSFIYRVYDIDHLPSDEKIDSDLNDLIKEYKELLNSNLESEYKTKMKFEYNSFLNALDNANLKFKKDLIVRLVSSLLAKPFVILTGLSGSGKTKIALSFIQWLCKDETQYEIVPVGADWTNREPLLGFPNALNQNEYIQPDSGVLTLLQNAKQNPELPYFLILDEMNLSHVERYFADFLSVMESKESIHLHSMEDCNVPNRIELPDNLFIIGTVNIDETTYMFSPKVLDRANTIEFRIDEHELTEFLKDNQPIKMSEIVGKGSAMATSFVNMAREKTTDSTEIINKRLVSFFSELKKAGAEFGYRTANEIHMLIKQLGNVENSLEDDQKLDIAVMQKLLPKLHGSRRKLEKVLTALCKLCLTDGIEDSKVNEYLTGELSIAENDVLLPISLEKIQRMYQAAIDHGFASYAEA